MMMEEGRERRIGSVVDQWPDISAECLEIAFHPFLRTNLLRAERDYGSRVSDFVFPGTDSKFKLCFVPSLCLPDSPCPSCPLCPSRALRGLGPTPAFVSIFRGD